MIEIPTTDKKFIQPNKSDNLGNLYATFNTDFKYNEGRVRISPRLILNTSTTDESTLTGTPVGFKTFDNGTGAKIYTVSGTPNVGPGYLFQGTSDPTGAFTHVTTSGAPSACDSNFSDIETFNGELYVTIDGANLYYLNGSNTWATIATGSSLNGFPRPLCNFPALSRLYTVIDGYKIVSSDTSHAMASIGSANTFSVDTAVNRQVVTFIKSGSDRLWIGTVNILGGRGHVYEYDGTKTIYDVDHVLEASGAISCVINNDVPEIIDSNGNYLIFNGSTFISKSGFYKKNKKPLYNGASKQNNRFIHPNGMAVIDGVTHLLVDLTNNDASAHGGTQEDCNPSGIWQYDEKTEDLKHKYSFGLNKSGGTITDYGQFRIAGAGALSSLIMNKDYPYNINNGQFLAGGTIYTDATTSVSGIFYDDTNDTLQKAGYIATAKISADDGTVYHLPSIQNTWQNIYTLYRKLITATDRIWVKYRTEDIVPTEATVTWVSTSIFTTSSTMTGFEGYEVEGIQGIGSGYSAHIQTVQPRSTDWLVILDNPFTGATGTSKVRVTNWKKLSTISNSSSATFSQDGMGDVTNWIQVKISMLFTGKNELEKIIIINQNANPAN